MHTKFLPSFFLLLLLAPAWVGAQTGSKSSALDSLRESHLLSVRVVGITDTLKSIVRVQVKEPGLTGESVQGATVLLRRDKDKMLGRVTKADGRCNFMPVPAEYTVRVQLTGYKTLEKSGLKFEAGKVYELDLRLARS